MAEMIFETIADGGCRAYLVGCAETREAILIDPGEARIGPTLGLLAREGLRLAYVIDTHTHADHVSAVGAIAQRTGARVAGHRLGPGRGVDLPLDDGDTLRVGALTLRALHTPGHTADSLCLVMPDRLFSGDTLLIGGAGRTDLPGGDPEALYESLFNGVLKLDPDLGLYPAHNYKGVAASTIGSEIAANPRLQCRDKAAFVAMMRQLNLQAPTHLTEALRVNTGGGKTVAALLAEARAATPSLSVEDLAHHLARADPDLNLLDVREKDDYRAGHIPGARHLPRGQIERRADRDLPDPTGRIVTDWDHGDMSLLAAAPQRTLGFRRTSVLDGGLQAWRETGRPVRGDDAP